MTGCSRDQYWKRVTTSERGRIAKEEANETGALGAWEVATMLNPD
jgi:hypothetical protein